MHVHICGCLEILYEFEFKQKMRFYAEHKVLIRERNEREIQLRIDDYKSQLDELEKQFKPQQSGMIL